MSAANDNNSKLSTMHPRVSIVLATWNAAQTLERCLTSIIGQQFSEWELLISDGGSTDGTIELIRQYENHIAWWNSEKDDGIYDAWNRAIVHSKGDYVCFLGADDAWADNGALARLFSAMDSAKYDLVTSRGLIFSSDSPKTSEFGAPWNFRRIGKRIVVCHPGMLHNRAIFDAYGLFDTRYRIAGDLEFLLRLPPDTQTKDVTTVTVRVQGGGVSRKNFYKRLKEQREILTRHQRFGRIRAYLVWLDRLWRYPVARLLRIPY
jgi:glycosyltransferase involved in cell wall biosynthesis